MLLREKVPESLRRRRPKSKVGLNGQARQPGEQYHLRAIARALDVLECFTDEAPNLNLRDIGAVVHLPESSLFRILLTLEGKGYLTQNPDGTYCLSPKLLL